MKSAWTQHITDDKEKVQFQASVIHSKWILEHLTLLLDKMEEGLEQQELSPRAYDQPNWDYRQAHANGFRQCLQKVKSLITLDQKDTNERPIKQQPG